MGGDGGAVFEGADGGGSYGDDAAVFAESGVDGGGGFGREGVALAVEVNVFDAIHSDGRKGAEADVEGDVGDLDAAVGDGLEDFRREVQAGGGRGDRAGLAGVDGLVALAVFGSVFAVNVGRQGDVAGALERGVKVGNGLEADGALAVFTMGDDLSLQAAVAEADDFAGEDFAPGADEGEPLPLGELLGEHDLDAAGDVVAGLGMEAGALAVEAGGDDAGVVEDEEVAGLKEGGKVAEVAVGEGSGGAVEGEHARGGAVGEGFLRDEFRWEVEIEFGDEH